MTIEKRYRLPELQKVVPLAKSTIYQKMAEGTFPRPHKLGARNVAWLESDISNWLDEQNHTVAA